MKVQINPMGYEQDDSPIEVKPMGALAIPTDKYAEIMSSSDYIAEPKFDGSRYILHFGKSVRLTSRRESVKGGMVEKSGNVPHIIQDIVDKLPPGTVLDGEINCPNGVRNFQYVQSIMGSLPTTAIATQELQGELIYDVFDLLAYSGNDLRDLPFHMRRGMLEDLFKHYSFTYLYLVPQRKDKEQFLKEQLDNGAEGIMLKNINSKYVEGKKPAHHWYKVKRVQTFDGIVNSYIPGQGKYAGMLGALIVKQYVGPNLVEVATISGMTDADRKLFKTRLDVGEEFIVEFEAQEAYGKNNRYRHPRYVRLREDKNPRECLYGKS